MRIITQFHRFTRLRWITTNEIQIHLQNAYGVEYMRVLHYPRTTIFREEYIMLKEF